MVRGDALYTQFVDILREELKPAMGCTEPIALAMAGAKARELLGRLPDKVELKVSGNIIKNVKSVVVPNTGGQHGMAAAVCAGIVAGDPSAELQVISNVAPEQHIAIREFIDGVQPQIGPAASGLIFDIDLTVSAGEDTARIRIVNHHTNIVLIEKNGQKLEGVALGDGPVDAAFLAIENILGCHYELDDFQIRSVTEGREAMGETVVKLRSGGKLYSGRGTSTDIVGSSIQAYINALNKITYEEAEAV